MARDLLGAVLVRIMADGTRLSGRIVEVEAYRPDDAASHSFRGVTPRTQAMFGEAGRLYLYFIYGVHFCANIVTEGEGVGAAVLLRALEPLEGVERMQTNYGRPMPVRDLCRGPGRLCKAMQMGRAENGYDLTQPNGQIYVERGTPVADDAAVTSARIGVVGDEQALTAAWRWTIRDSLYISRRPAR